MEVHFTPEVEAKLERVARESGRSAGQLVQEVVTSFVDELASIPAMLDSRYDDLQNGRVRPIPGEEVEAYFRQKSAQRLQLDS